MTRLELITNKIKRLDAGETATTNLGFEHGHIDYVSIPIPPTPKGQELLRALLVEIGRHECDLANAKKNEFVSIVNAEKT